MKPICAECEVELKPEKNGVYIAEMFQKNTKVYRLWHGDLLKCPACDKKIVSNFATKPLAEHHDCSGKDLFGKDIMSLEQRVEELIKRGEVVVRNLEIWR